MVSQGPRLHRQPEPEPDPNDVAEAMEPGVVLDDADAEVLAEVAQVRGVLGSLNEDLMIIDYGARERMYRLGRGEDREQAG
jgi:hypothetical protein